MTKYQRFGKWFIVCEWPDERKISPILSCANEKESPQYGFTKRSDAVKEAIIMNECNTANTKTYPEYVVLSKRYCELVGLLKKDKICQH
jgi:hypothetical protein